MGALSPLARILTMIAGALLLSAPASLRANEPPLPTPAEGVVAFAWVDGGALGATGQGGVT